ncbi:putative coatomer alpha subunit [Hibiscus syriacus]|uniref:Coatomer alpha subunit n=1 Tax=Hibiscus syriacus TaxID=106335 RepID=A0A6A3D009_HIBSY|nr:putative coatomer alpha subunit [Hibiscus syriacus]
MGFASVKPGANTSNCNKESKVMGLLLVFFHGGGDQTKITSDSTAINDQNNTTNTTPTTRLMRRRTSSTLLSSKAQFTISICLLLVFITLLLFTLSTFEPSPTIKNPRRILYQKTQFPPPPFKGFFPIWDYKPLSVKQKPSVSPSSFALQRMGILYRRGTKAMNDLIVGHVDEGLTEDELRLFLRVLHRSGITSKADIVFLFASSTSTFSNVIHEENDSFLKLIQHYNEPNSKGHRDSVFGFDSTQFWKSGKKEVGETIWGKKGARGNSSNSTEAEGESTRLTYGSVVGFDVNELDPENSLAGFLDHVSMSFRRWACYPMLLGRIRRNFKHIMLLDVKSLMVLSDPLGRVRNRSPESVYLLTKESTRGIRRLANAMLTEIARATMQHKKKKNSISESEILSQLVGNGHVLKNVDVITSSESIQEASSLTGSRSNSAAADFLIIQRGNSNHDLHPIIMQLMCLSETNSYVYRDC